MLENKEKLAKLVAYQSHRGQKRKTTGTPYIEHPKRVAKLLRNNGASEDLIVSGYLHDVLEDTNTTLEELQKMFTQESLDIVLSHTEDKSLSWEERKQHTIDSMLTGSQDTVWLVLADKYDNLNDTVGYDDSDWKHFKRGKEDQFWYNNSILQNALTRKDITLPPYTKDLEELIKIVFVD